MLRTKLLLLLSAAAMTACGGAMIAGGGGGGVSASAEVSVSAEIKLPIAKMPTKYASWVVEAEGYLWAVNNAYNRFTKAKAELASVLGVATDANAIAAFIRDAVKVETTLVCEPPRFEAGLVASCQADASARARGSAGSGGASGSAAAGIQANCQARASLDLSPGKCTIETTVSEHPILGDMARFARIQQNMAIMLQIGAANVHLDGRGAEINARGMKLYAESITDLKDDPTLALQLNNIQAELKRGSDTVSAANETQSQMNRELGMMVGAINDQFPDMKSTVSM